MTEAITITQSKSSIEFSLAYDGFQFLPYGNKVDCIRSSPVHKNETTTWQAELYPGGSNPANPTSVSFFIVWNSVTEPFCAKLSLTITGHQLTKDYSLPSKRISSLDNRCGWDYWMPRDDLIKNFCVNDVLTMRVSLVTTVRDVFETNSMAAPSKRLRLQDTNYPSVGSRFLFVEESSDVILEVQSEKEEVVAIPAHKLFLCSASPVLARMLSVDMMEKETNKVVMKDFPASVVREALRFIYTNEFETTLSENNFEQLLAFACLYEITNLKDCLEKRYIDSLNTDNIAHALFIVQTYACPILESAVVDYAKTYLKQVLGNMDSEVALRILGEMVKSVK